jgi:hypothetical protein
MIPLIHVRENFLKAAASEHFFEWVVVKGAAESHVGWGHGEKLLAGDGHTLPYAVNLTTKISKITLLNNVQLMPTDFS